uniref:Uncharacterized protein n=1 Tax=Arundo donax TaxID=35708 RepID=A0A0A9BLL4_ARUDO
MSACIGIFSMNSNASSRFPARASTSTIHA